MALEQLGTLALVNTAHIHQACAKMRTLLHTCAVATDRMDYLLSGFTTLCRGLQAAGAQNMDIFLGVQALRLQATCATRPHLPSAAVFFALRSGDSVDVVVDVMVATSPQHAVVHLREVLSVKTREQLIVELEQHKANLERDVAERTAAMVQREGQIRDMLEQSPVALRVSVLKDRGLLFVNQACADLFQQPKTNLAELSTWTTYDNPDDDLYIGEVLRRGENILNLPLAIRTKNNTVLQVMASFIHITYDNSPCVIAWFFDVTELRRAKELAEEVTRMRTDFLANMSHEIRTPMNAIIGIGHLVLKTALTPQQTNYLQKITSASQSLLRIINDILDFAKIDAGKMTLEAAPFPLRGMLTEVFDLVGERAKEKALSLDMDVPRSMPMHFVGDAFRLSQVLVNLLSNAIKFTATGEVVLTVRQGRVADNARTELLFFVRDTGIGMSPDQLRKIFQPFSQADSSTTRQFGGTGLGLVIAHQLVTQMEGLLQVESTLGQGSVFHFSVWLGEGTALAEPLVLDMATQHDAGGAHRADLAGLHLLLIEDNLMNQEVALALLTNVGITAAVANHGQEALTLLAAESFDGILSDIQMPIMDGYQTARAIRQQPQFKDTIIIALTANAMPNDLARCTAAGMNDHVAKPINVDKLYATLNQWLGARAQEKRAGALVCAPSPSTRHLAQETTQPVTLQTAVVSIAPPPPPLSNDLPQLTGVDVLRGLSHVAGNAWLYLKLLKSFLDHEHDFPERFTVLAQASDWAAAQRAAHTLKGLAGTLGALSLQAVAARLEAQSNPDQAMDAVNTLAELTPLLRALTLNIATALAPPPAKDPEHTHFSGVNMLTSQHLTTLRGLLEDSDAEVLDVLEAMNFSQTSAVTQRLFATLSAYVQAFEFQEALAVLALIEGMLPAG